MCGAGGVTQKMTMSYRPKTNMTEKVNRTLKSLMASYVSNHHRDWDVWLSEFWYAFNTAIHETLE